MSQTTTLALTIEQQQLATDNHRLIYQYAKENALDLEDYYDILAIGLCRAAALYDATLGYKFSTFAWKCMMTEHYHHKKYQARKSRIPASKVVSYDVPFSIDDDSNEATFLDILSEKYKPQHIDVTNIEVRQFRNSLTGRQQVVLDLLMAGYRQSAIASVLGCARQRVSVEKGRIKEKWLQYDAA